MALLRWKFVEGRTIDLMYNSGLELPSNIGELGDSVTKIDLSHHNLRGARKKNSIRISNGGPKTPGRATDARFRQVSCRSRSSA